MVRFIRKFNGKRYALGGVSRGTLKEALISADKYRKVGHSARTAKNPDGSYAVYFSEEKTMPYQTVRFGRRVRTAYKR